MNKERYWTFIIYPESVKEDYIEYLQQTGLQVAISPLHDKDKNPDGTTKKPHYHILVCFAGPTTYNRVVSITEYLGATIPQRVMSAVGIIRYFTHQDNPEKYQYNKEDIKTINGLDLNQMNEMTATQIENIKWQLIDLIQAQNISEYADLIDELKNIDYKEGLEVASNKTIFFNTYISSRRFKTRE